MRTAAWVAALGLTLGLHANLTLAAAAGPALQPPSRAVQRQTLIASVSRMASGSIAAGDVYFVGFAGFGEQKVFRKEAELARQVFGARFASGSRSLLLVNDIHDRRTYPLATFANLRVAVNAIGRRMHRGRDTLVLMLTSHGNDEDGIAITNGNLPEDALSPEDVPQDFGRVPDPLAHHRCLRLLLRNLHPGAQERFDTDHDRGGLAPQLLWLRRHPGPDLLW